jgi:polyhydroxybutyrate depolymerase
MKPSLTVPLPLLCTLALAVGCSSASSPPNAGGGGGGGEAAPLVVGGDRPVTVHVPPGLDPKKPAPLVILLHGYGAGGLIQELYFQIEPLADQHGFLYAHPDGTVDSSGKRFWNATDACCNFDGSKVDDVAYLSGLVAEIGQHYAVDPKRVYFMGHSNGGFMSHRMACDRADLVAAIAPLAGVTWSDPSKCAPSAPVSVLQIHGTADPEVIYTGSSINGDTYPGAVETAQEWAKLDGCDASSPEMGAALDLEGALDGAETTVQRFTTGCKASSAVELWSIQGGTHIPALGPNFAPDVIDWLLAHPKP